AATRCKPAPSSCAPGARPSAGSKPNTPGKAVFTSPFGREVGAQRRVRGPLPGGALERKGRGEDNHFPPPSKSPTSPPMLDAPRPFLDVSRSVTDRAWTDRLDATTTRTATAIAQRSGISEILARIIAARGV